MLSVFFIEFGFAFVQVQVLDQKKQISLITNKKYFINKNILTYYFEFFENLKKDWVVGIKRRPTKTNNKNAQRKLKICAK